MIRNIHQLCFVALLAFGLAACSSDQTADNAADGDDVLAAGTDACQAKSGDLTDRCPTGTAIQLATEARQESGGSTSVAGEGNGTTQSGSGSIDDSAYVFTEGECEYACTPIQDCPEGTSPVVTAESFTCDVVGSDADCVDEDGDGFGTGCEAGSDCDDADEDVNPDASDNFGNGTDENCDGMDGVDADGDGAASDQFGNGTDCDDDDANVNPGADEVAGNGKDDDCDDTTAD